MFRKTNISAKVVENEWPVKQAVPISSINKIKLRIEHWVNGILWDVKGGMYEYHNQLAQERIDKGLPAGNYSNIHYRDSSIGIWMLFLNRLKVMANLNQLIV